MSLSESKYTKAQGLTDSVLRDIDDIWEIFFDREATYIFLKELKKARNAIAALTDEEKSKSQEITKSIIEALIAKNDEIIDFYKDDLDCYPGNAQYLETLKSLVFNTENIEPNAIIDFLNLLNNDLVDDFNSYNDGIETYLEDIDSSIGFYLEGFFISHKFKIKKLKEQVLYNIDKTLSAAIDKLAYLKMLTVVNAETVKMSANENLTDNSKESISASICFLLNENDRINGERYYESPNGKLFYPYFVIYACIDQFDTANTIESYLEFLNKITADCVKEIAIREELSSVSDLKNLIKYMINSAFGIWNKKQYCN